MTPALSSSPLAGEGREERESPHRVTAATGREIHGLNINAKIQRSGMLGSPVSSALSRARVEQKIGWQLV